MTDNNFSWPPFPGSPGGPSSVKNAKIENAKNGVKPPSFLWAVARVSLNILCFCAAAYFSFIAGIYSLQTWMPQVLPWFVAGVLSLVMVIELLTAAVISRCVKPHWLKAAVHSVAWGASAALLCLLAWMWLLTAWVSLFFIF